MRLLVVEDETRMAALLRRGLQEERYAVDVAADGVQALWQAGEYDYDAIVFDEDTARSGRVRGVPADPRPRPVGPGAAADRPRRDRKPGPGAGRRCRRPPGQAVRLRRTHRAAAGGAAAGPAATSHGVGVGTSNWIRRPGRYAAPAGAASSRARRALLRCWGSGQAEAAVVAGRSDGEGELGERGGHAVAPSYFGREFVAAAPQVLNERMPGRDDPGADSS